jgi:hypothetical protein
VLLDVHAPAAPPLRRELRGPTTLGGSAADGITVPGLPPAALRIEPRASGLVCAPAAPGLRVGARLVAPGTRRLLRPGERASFLRLELTVPEPTAPRPGEHTRAAAAALLREAARDPAAPSGPHLVILTGPHAGERAALGPELMIGRGRGAALRLADAATSRRHARLRLGPDGATLEDLGAKNRVRVNGVPVERRPVPLRPGDLITVGETELVYALAAQGSPVPARAPPRRRRPRRPAGARPLVAAALLALSAAALAAIASCGG